MATSSGEYVIPRSARKMGDDPQAPIMVQVFAQSDVGQTRDHNEDAFLVANLSGGEPLTFDRLIEQPADDMGTLFMVADGMGGAAAGEIASATAVDVVLRHLRDGLAGKEQLSPDELVGEIVKAADIANWSIFTYAASHPDLRGMGTTATIATLLGDTLYVAQVGDSRAYIVRDGQATQITKDQSLMQKLIDAGELTEAEAAQSERRNIILQALGPEPIVKLDLTYQKVRQGDVLIICSDGLSGLVRPELIGQVVSEELDLATVCDRLIETANDLGGPDNITVVAARFDGHALEQEGRPGDVGYRVFTIGDERPDTTAERSRLPTPRAMVGDAHAAIERLQRGALYTRIIAAAGVLLLLFIAWQLLQR